MFEGWGVALSYWPDFLSGLVLTAEVSLLSFALAFVLGVLGALARRSGFGPLRLLGAVYVEAIRNTPVLLQIFMIFFALPQLGLRLTAFDAGVAALGINAGAYLTEIIRAGLQAVPRGQVEAARSLGLRQRDIFRFVVFPQALRYVYPPVINQFIQVILGSSLVSTIALPELTSTTETINSTTLLTMQLFTVALVLYLLLSNVTSALADVVGRHAFKPPLYTRPSGRGGLALRRRLQVLVGGGGA
jgi:polar amino acid transport system permease protein